MEKLTLKQKQIIIGTNHYIGEFNHYINEDAYGNTASYQILDRWLSEILDLDYRNDIYNNKHLIQLNQLDSVKKTFTDEYKGSWFIGDELKSSLYTLIHYNTNSEADIEAKEQELRDMWAFFKALLPMYKEAPKQEEIYAPSGVIVNGEMLYRKVGPQKKAQEGSDDWFLEAFQRS